MKKMKIIIQAVCLLIIFETRIQAQSNVIAGGGDATGNSGSMSYSVGQVNYIFYSNNTGTVTQGLQQPFEIFLYTGIEDSCAIKLEYLAYPNPTSGDLKLLIENSDSGDLSFQLCDVNGKILMDKKVENDETIIDLKGLKPSVYFLIIIQKTEEIKSFKIIKK